MSSNPSIVQLRGIDDEIEDLAKRPDGTKANFVPEHSLKNLLKSSTDGPKKLLMDHLREKRVFVDVDVNRAADIARFICEEAPKTFATLIFSDLEHLIVTFFENNFNDSLLPVVKIPDRSDMKLASFPAEAAVELANLAVRLANDEASSIKDTNADTRKKKAHAIANANAAALQADQAREDAAAADRKVSATFTIENGWKSRWINKFCDEYQWRFTAPVFNEVQFSYLFAEKAEMPFWPCPDVRPKYGPFSYVQKWQVHRNHLSYNHVSHHCCCISLCIQLCVPVEQVRPVAKHVPLHT